MAPARHLLIASLAVLCATQASASTAPTPAPEEQGSGDNGTDPTKMSRSIALQHEHIALRGGGSTGSMKLSYAMPLGEGKNQSLRVRLPVNRVSPPGQGSHTGVGDAAIQLTRVFGLTSRHGYVAQGEWVFDTARRAELGSGRSVLKGTLVYVMFFEDGRIFAPAVVHSRSVAGGGDRPGVNTTAIDFYYVPKLQDNRTFVTLDPALSVDWEHRKHHPSLAVTVGRALGPALGGSAQVFVKPSVFGGGERSANWGLEVGFKVIGF